MPYLHIHTNCAVDDSQALLRHCSQTLAAALAKPESYVMVELSAGKPMLFAGSDAPLAFLQLTSLGLTAAETAALSAQLCGLMEELLGVDSARVYIAFDAPERAMFGWKGGTF